jgi:oligoribonuclease
VSTLKELGRRWAPQLVAGFAKQAAHLALADIHESIRELAWYRSQLFVDAAQGPRATT